MPNADRNKLQRHRHFANGRWMHDRPRDERRHCRSTLAAKRNDILVANSIVHQSTSRLRLNTGHSRYSSSAGTASADTKEEMAGTTRPTALIRMIAQGTNGGTSKHLVKPITDTLTLTMNFQMPPDITSADAEEDIGTTAVRRKTDHGSHIRLLRGFTMAPINTS